MRNSFNVHLINRGFLYGILQLTEYSNDEEDDPGDPELKVAQLVLSILEQLVAGKARGIVLPVGIIIGGYFGLVFPWHMFL